MTDIEKLLKNADRDPMFLASKEYAEMREYYTDDANKVEYDMDKEIDNLTSYRMKLAWEALERSRKEQEDADSN